MDYVLADAYRGRRTQALQLTALKSALRMRCLG